MTSNYTVLVTGGAGFLGSNLCLYLKKQHPDWHVIAVDNLKRRGSELNIPRLRLAQIQFNHADVRISGDLSSLPKIDLIIECSAEPSVLAGVSSSPQYLLDTNLVGAINCFELARRHQAKVMFISTSRVYPYSSLNAAAFDESKKRYDYAPTQSSVGLSPQGITEEYPLAGQRSLYGATKLNAEFLLQEYAATYDVSFIINRFGCLAGPWQMGKTDQGVLALWVYRHLTQQALTYTGFGGTGKQVRDFLHIQDACDVIDQEITSWSRCQRQIFNIGGGQSYSVSLRELTIICQSVTGYKIKITADPHDRPVDLKNYISDNSLINRTLGWSPRHNVITTVRDTSRWMLDHLALLKPILEEAPL